MMQSHFERLEERQRKEHLRTHFFLSEVHRLAPEHASTRVRFRDARRFFSSVYALLESEQDRRQFERQRNVVFSAWANEYESRLAAGEASHLSVSFYKLFAGDFEGALESALGGLEKKPDDLALMTNYAHALMFLDRREEAMEAYRQHATDQVDGRVWWEIIEDDFEQLEGVGWTHPVMREIRDYFATLAEDAA